MTREEFTKQLDKKKYSYEIEGDKIIIISGYGGDVYLKSLTGDYFHEWKGNIKGIDKKRLLNGMIKRGIFL